jgi:hypothetical protein
MLRDSVAKLVGSFGAVIFKTWSSVMPNLSSFGTPWARPVFWVSIFQRSMVAVAEAVLLTQQRHR